MMMVKHRLTLHSLWIRMSMASHASHLWQQENIIGSLAQHVVHLRTVTATLYSSHHIRHSLLPRLPTSCLRRISYRNSFEPRYWILDWKKSIIQPSPRNWPCSPGRQTAAEDSWGTTDAVRSKVHADSISFIGFDEDVVILKDSCRWSLTNKGIKKDNVRTFCPFILSYFRQMKSLMCLMSA